MTSYTTPAELRASIGSQVAGSSDDVLVRVIEAVSQWIDQWCNRPDGFKAVTTASARTFAGNDSEVQVIDECIAVTLVESKTPTASSWTSWAASDWVAFSGSIHAPDFNHTPYTALAVAPGGAYAYFPSGKRRALAGFRYGLSMDQPDRPWNAPTVRVTARWGYAEETPPAIREACIMQAARQFKRGQSAYSDATASPEFGVLNFQGLDPAVENILTKGRFKRPRS